MWHYAECRYYLNAILSVVILNIYMSSVVILIVAMPNAVMLDVVRRFVSINLVQNHNLSLMNNFAAAY